MKRDLFFATAVALCLAGCKGVQLPPCLTDGTLCQPTPTPTATVLPTATIQPTDFPTIAPTPTPTITPTTGPNCKYPEYPVCNGDQCVCSGATPTATFAPSPTPAPTKPVRPTPEPSPGFHALVKGFGVGLLGGNVNTVPSAYGTLVELDSTVRVCMNANCGAPATDATGTTSCDTSHMAWYNSAWCGGFDWDTPGGPGEWRIEAFYHNAKHPAKGQWRAVTLYAFDPKTRSYQPVVEPRADYQRWMPLVHGQQVRMTGCSPRPHVTTDGRVALLFKDGCVTKVTVMP